MRKIYKIIIVISVILIGCSSEKEIFISYSNPEIKYWGRIDTTRVNAAELYWSGTSIKFNFEGKSIKALLKDESVDNYYNLIIDNTVDVNLVEVLGYPVGYRRYCNIDG